MSARTDSRSSSPVTTPQLSDTQCFSRQSNSSPSSAEESGFVVQQPKDDYRWRNLRIDVPDSSPSDKPSSLKSPASVYSASQLAAPIDISPSNSFDMGSITQLPTPVLNSGSFAQSKITLLKRSQVHSSSSGPSHRAVSEFQPGSIIKRGETPNPISINNRHVSNPSSLDEEASAIPSPPSEVDHGQLIGRIIDAPRLHKSYVFDEVVGKGTFSTVVRAHSTANLDDIVAVKIVEVPTSSKEDVSNFRSYICRELGILTHLKHPCIVGLLDYSINLSITQDEIDQAVSGNPLSAPMGSDMYDFYNIKVHNKQNFILNYCKGGNLFHWLYDHHRESSKKVGFWEVMRRIVAELIVCVAFLHTHDVVHRDLKLENVLLNFSDKELGDSNISHKAEPLCTLTDFGLSKKLTSPNQLLSTKCGSQDYVSPELLMGLEYDGKLLDSWSLGVLIYAILEDRLPFDVPPLEFMSNSAISPSVLKRRRKRHNPAHRIAMIDWEWLRIAATMKDDTFPEASKFIMNQLVAVVDVLLVRKDRRLTATQVLHDERFQWIKEQVPSHFLEHIH
ncbi:hypothetical protein FT663_00444 [Candidozyma haemuli var. vulneris]|uniref:Protein kinase domain-containing protein n=1 Tax=Candidozyma haemuli TaxID=45357 RepID=A0A2V1ARJ9_9ASCO|nr:hypothetical protein CXQ85_002291 [[Candida] haemuloni]KAF3993421.1 hypothetical protein FT662_00550 [[Candida] haemuloni var. vulneris]KAF3995391.1 hypothetical protein FT663_00444 [[Candida] haemuloni var. vulneris]PVH20499.1 hypothetical protein CXQ85_002291 [[Candida] haemuloni]